MAVRGRGKKLIIDYYPQGRRGPRKWITLPETIQDEEEAKKIEAIIKKAERQPEQVEIQSTMTIKEAFPDYL